MYFKKILLAFLTIVGSSDIWTVRALRYRRTTKPPWFKGTTVQDVIMGNKRLNRHHRQTEKHSVESSTQFPSQYPPIFHYPYLPQRPPQDSQQYPSTCLPPEIPPQYPSSSPQPTIPSTIIDEFDNRYQDGSYEYRYKLADETVRYERGYFVHNQDTKTLIVKGYYSYRLRDRRYLTVFYTADQYGYRQDSSTFSWDRPILHRVLGDKADTSTEVIRTSGMDNSITNKHVFK